MWIWLGDAGRMPMHFHFRKIKLFGKGYIMSHNSSHTHDVINFLLLWVVNAFVKFTI
jgi:hypothetical protein